MRSIDYHSDDYGISLTTSRTIIELVKAGKLDSFSILTNFSCYEECMELLEREWISFKKKPLMSVHLNLVGGLSLCREGRLEYKWSYLFLRSFIPGRRRSQFKQEIKNEFKHQIERVINSPLTGNLRLDSHQHTHMTPIVFDAMMEAVSEMGVMNRVEFVRITREPIAMFFGTKGVMKTVPPVNFVKNIILNILARRVVRKLKPYSLDKAMVWGMMRSGMITADHHEAMKKQMLEYANKKDRYIELVAHPGQNSAPSDLEECCDADKVFCTSDLRTAEYNMLLGRSNA